MYKPIPNPAQDQRIKRITCIAVARSKAIKISLDVGSQTNRLNYRLIHTSQHHD
jgi:hypothetical protein